MHYFQYWKNKKWLKNQPSTKFFNIFLLYWKSYINRLLDFVLMWLRKLELLMSMKTELLKLVAGNIVNICKLKSRF